MEIHNNIKTIIKRITPGIDLFLSPVTFLSAVLFFVIRRIGVQRLRLCKKILMKIGIFPIRDHYFEPMFNPKNLRYSLKKDRTLQGIDFNIEEQLRILDRFHFNDELEVIPLEKGKNTKFFYHNGSFGPGDAEYLYSIIRLYKPKKIVEVGSGNSTLMVINAVNENKRENVNYKCEHICIEPYEKHWLEQMGIKVIRERVEKIDKNIFSQLDINDILFIDSSHMIRPQGDVLFECFEVLPILKPGIFIHIHDIFTPKDYL